MNLTIVKNMAEDESGFTLVEMMVGLCIAGLLAGLMAGALMQLRPMRILTEKAEAGNELHAVAGYLEKLLSMSRNLPLLDSDQNRRQAFIGDKQAMRFVAVTRVGSEQSSLRDVEISVKGKDGSLALVQTNTMRRLSEQLAKEEFVVFDKLESVRFEFLAVRNGGMQAEWQGEWRDRRSLPLAVRITLTLERLGQKMTAQRTAYLLAVSEEDLP